MAYINTRTFDIIQSGGEYDTSGEYFEVDDMIAPAISILNKKGYKTKYSCSGHAYPDLIDLEYSVADSDIENTMVRLSKMENTRCLTLVPDGTIHCLAYTEDRETNLYINFSEDIKIPSIPYGAELEENNTMRICYAFNNTDSFRKMAECMALNRIVYEWACSLPVSAGTIVE